MLQQHRHPRQAGPYPTAPARAMIGRASITRCVIKPQSPYLASHSRADRPTRRMRHTRKRSLGKNSRYEPAKASVRSLIVTESASVMYCDNHTSTTFAPSRSRSHPAAHRNQGCARPIREGRLPAFRPHAPAEKVKSARKVDFSTHKLPHNQQVKVQTAQDFFAVTGIPKPGLDNGEYESCVMRPPGRNLPWDEPL